MSGIVRAIAGLGPYRAATGRYPYLLTHEVAQLRIEANLRLREDGMRLTHVRIVSALSCAALALITVAGPPARAAAAGGAILPVTECAAPGEAELTRQGA